MKRKDLYDLLCIKKGKMLHSKDLGEEVSIALETVVRGMGVEMVVGPKLSANDFYVLANIVEKFPNLAHIYFRKTSPPYHSGMIGKNIYFNNKVEDDKDYSVTKVIENISEDLEKAYIKGFEDYKSVAKLATPELLRTVAQLKEKEQIKNLECEK